MPRPAIHFSLSNFKPNNFACDKRSESTNGLSVAQDAARNERKPPLITGSKLEKAAELEKRFLNELKRHKAYSFCYQLFRF